MKTSALPVTLAHRSNCLRIIREHFFHTGAIEVDTELLAPTSVTDPYMSAMQVVGSRNEQLGFLQTSPEYAMKKLLCGGSGDIYQLSKVFRADEQGRHHLGEFTMLEWYRLGVDEFELMTEVYQLICLIAGQRPREDLSYRQAFINALGLDPFAADVSQIKALAERELGELPQGLLKDNYLTLLFAEKVETRFDPHAVTFVYDFPASQASLAQTRTVDYGQVGRRFEAYSGGLELANGFNELTDAKEQLARFKQDNRERQQLGYPQRQIDNELIAAMELGLPQCSGVALGFDRLLMLAYGIDDIGQLVPRAFYPPR